LDASSTVVSDRLEDPARGCLEAIDWRIPLMLFAVVAVTFARSIGNDFAGYDNLETIVGNSRVNEPSFEKLLYFWRHPDLHIYIPITYTAWGAIAWLARLSGYAPGGTLQAFPFHAASVIAHALATAAAFLVLRQLMRRNAAAACGALLFGLHPVQVEAVAWASGLKDVLCGLFSLVAIWQYVAWASDDQPQSPRGRRRYRVSLVALLVALLSKPSAVTVPLIMAVVDLVLVRRRPFRKVAFSLIPFVAMAAIAALLGRMAQPARTVGLPLWMRPLIAADSLAFYLWKLVCPATLTLDYARTPEGARVAGLLWWTWMVPLALALLLWKYRKRDRRLTAAAMLLVVALLPTLGWMRFDYQRISTVADHYLYVAMLGPALALAVGAEALAGRNQLQPRATVRPWLSGACLAALFAGLAVRSNVQFPCWRDELSLWRHAVAICPDSYNTHEGLGHAYQHAGPEFKGAALREFQRMAVLNAGFAHGQEILAGAYMSLGRADESLDCTLRYIRLKRRDDLLGFTSPNDIDARAECCLAVGELLLARGRPAEAVEMFEIALALRPDDPAPVQRLTVARELLADTATPAPRASVHEDP
jgi:tetratricopeptide (TPR) repeat protein